MSAPVWQEWPGGDPPWTPETRVLAQIRCMTRERAEQLEAREVRWWRRWWHDGGPGDIVAVARV